MSTLIEFFKGFGDAVVSVFDFIISFFQDIAYLIKLTGDFVLRIPQYLSFIPPEVMALITLILTIVVLYKVLGREG